MKNNGGLLQFKNSNNRFSDSHDVQYYSRSDKADFIIHSSTQYISLFFPIVLNFKKGTIQYWNRALLKQNRYSSGWGLLERGSFWKERAKSNQCDVSVKICLLLKSFFSGRSGLQYIFSWWVWFGCQFSQARRRLEWSNFWTKTVVSLSTSENTTRR